MDFQLQSELLISEVEKHPCIWDSNRAAYLDRNAKVRAWDNIAMALNSDLTDEDVDEFIKEAQKRWRHIKDSCLKYLKKSTAGLAVGEAKFVKRRPYLYMKQLKFILPILNSKRTSTDNSEDPTESNNSASGSEELSITPIKKRKLQDSRSDNSIQLTTLPISPSTDPVPKSEHNLKKPCDTMSLPNEPPKTLSLNESGYYGNQFYTPPGSALTHSRFDLLGRNWSEKMKTLTYAQRIFAEKLINDVFYEAEMGRLDRGCHVVVSSSS